ncbi:uncharacterized protein K452DRAFT_316531 [Aplosporella prunicola CBS 121167]|uniref:Mediator of RNA polymerase II transcription subunit 11 n=1 Tax=Aplosporella prunicola CBS 121167 TaxID=1176127 RepID=A0A6A6BNX9_9PEZI|nr:uncharacterized protein K452DRAFT_316531 [Aplosporella prunicola CBS 121167]KAF2144557.1 hypothetical protein K452DRAFT_316531 [Aplosporella prunicola CBS 121167]
MSSNEATDSARNANGNADLPAERIKALSEIKEAVPQLVRAAGLAIDALSNRPLNGDSTADALQARKDAFSTHTAEYFQKLKMIGERLNDEAQALADAGVIPATAEKLDEQAASGNIKNGGMGELDIGWLNARAKDPGVEKALELFDEAEERLKIRVEEREKGERRRE